LPNQPPVDFTDPPVSEVVCGMVISPLEPFNTGMYGRLWGAYDQEFPLTVDAPPLVQPGRAADALALRRVWFMSDNQRYLIQVQPDRFYFNWRRLEPDDTYPRYESVYAAFKRHLRRFREFVDQQPELGPIEVEEFHLTYVNAIPLDTAAYSSVGEVMPDLSWSNHRVLKDPNSFAWRVEGPAPFGEDSTLRIDARSQSDGLHAGRSLRLELAARGPGSLDDVDTWFAHAHDSIVHGFVDLTSPTSHQRWGKQ
jgi:uncharacterized protein (TIGR04255 family)